MATSQSFSDQSSYLSHPSVALHATQHAPNLLEKPSPFRISFTTADSSDQWITYEQMFLVCLRTGDDKTAHLCLNRLTERFGQANERVMGLRGLYQEATAKDAPALTGILRDYDRILQENPVNVPILKRRIALLRSLARDEEAISALVDYLEAFPTDAEAWCELADCYLVNAMSAQAIFSLEEALLVIPNSWTLHARLGEILYMSTTSTDSSTSNKPILARSVRHFLRSIELCEGYPRAIYGLILVTSKLNNLPEHAAGDDGDGTRLPSKEVYEELNSMARQKAKEILHSQPTISSPHEAQDGLLALRKLVQQE